MGTVPFKPAPRLAENFKMGSLSNEMFEELKSRLNKLTINPFISVLKKNENLDLNQILNHQEETYTQINRIKCGKIKNQPYYHLPSPIDAQFENKAAYKGVSFSGENICKWNVDGLTDYQIVVLFKHMTIYV